MPNRLFIHALSAIERSRQEVERDFTRLAHAVCEARVAVDNGDSVAALELLEAAGDIEYNLIGDMPATAPLLGRLRLLAAIPSLREAGYHPMDNGDHLIVVDSLPQTGARVISELLGLEHYEISPRGNCVRIEA